MNNQQDLTDRKLILMEYFSIYMLEIRRVKQSTVDHYFEALRHISKRLKDMNLVRQDIYEIADLERLLTIRNILFADTDFIELNKRGNQMYSAGLNNYYRFACGKDFGDVGDKIKIMDIPVSHEQSVVVEKKVWKRSGILRRQVIEMAEYKCEINPVHKSFVAEFNNMPYMEAHHAIPMELQDEFDNSLDVYANIICLCPLCHRQIHYGLKDERKEMISYIYTLREDRLKNCGLDVNKDDFAEMIMAV